MEIYQVRCPDCGNSIDIVRQPIKEEFSIGRPPAHFKCECGNDFKENLPADFEYIV